YDNPLGILHDRTIRPVVRISSDNVELEWHLWHPAEQWRLLLPVGAKLSVPEFFFVGQPLADFLFEGWYRAASFVVSCVSAGMFLFWLGQRVGLLHQVLSKPMVAALIMVGLHGVLMIWLLPPFQGPD